MAQDGLCDLEGHRYYSIHNLPTAISLLPGTHGDCLFEPSVLAHLYCKQSTAYTCRSSSFYTPVLCQAPFSRVFGPCAIAPTRYKIANLLVLLAQWGLTLCLTPEGSQVLMKWLEDIGQSLTQLTNIQKSSPLAWGSFFWYQGHIENWASAVIRLAFGSAVTPRLNVLSLSIGSPFVSGGRPPPYHAAFPVYRTTTVMAPEYPCTISSEPKRIHICSFFRSGFIHAAVANILNFLEP